MLYDTSTSYINFSYLVIAAAAAKSLQSCPTLWDPIDGSPPGSHVPGILQARTLEWVAISFSNAWKWKVKVKLLSRVHLFSTPWTAAYQAPQSMGFPRQEYWSGVPLPSLTGLYPILYWVPLGVYPLGLSKQETINSLLGLVCPEVTLFHSTQQSSGVFMSSQLYSNVYWWGSIWCTVVCKWKMERIFSWSGVPISQADFSWTSRGG